MIDAVSQASTANTLVNQADGGSLSSRVVTAIKTAAQKTGVDFSYLLHKAAQESGFDPNAKASSSSATGLFQFTNQTWLQMLKEHGGQYGLSAYADHIQVDNNGVAHVSDPSMRKVILGLRKDPEISAEMAGELDKENLDSLQANVGGKINATDLYMAHFLGAGGASTFLKQMKSNPNAEAASVLPDAAASNPAVFYGSNGVPRTLKQIYQHFAQKFQNTDSSTLVADASSSMPAHAVVSGNVASASYATASAAYTNMANSSSSYMPSLMNDMMKSNAASSSLMATMIMAQMHTNDLPSTGLTASTLDSHGKKSAIALLGAIG